MVRQAHHVHFFINVHFFVNVQSVLPTRKREDPYLSFTEIGIDVAKYPPACGDDVQSLVEILLQLPSVFLPSLEKRLP